MALGFVWFTDAPSQCPDVYKIHLFGEGKVNQPNHYPRTNELARLPRFKWGVYVYLLFIVNSDDDDLEVAAF
jgi:hypothetical protein